VAGAALGADPGAVRPHRRPRSATWSAIQQGLARRTGRPVAIVRSATRPVPLRFEYRRTPLNETNRVAPRSRPSTALCRPLHPGAGAHPRPGTHLGTGDDAVLNGRRSPRRLWASAFAPGSAARSRALLHHGIGVHHGGMPAQVPPPGGAAHEVRPAACRRRYRHAWRRGQPAVADGRALGSRQVRRVDLPTA